MSSSFRRSSEIVVRKMFAALQIYCAIVYRDAYSDFSSPDDDNKFRHRTLYLALTRLVCY